jgi:hypothetical protein
MCLRISISEQHALHPARLRHVQLLGQLGLLAAQLVARGAERRRDLGRLRGKAGARRQERVP